jgi:hypothetical protein
MFVEVFSVVVGGSEVVHLLHHDTEKERQAQVTIWT